MNLQLGFRNKRHDDINGNPAHHLIIQHCSTSLPQTTHAIAQKREKNITANTH